MRLTFEKELQRQRTEEEAKVQEIRRQADQVRSNRQMAIFSHFLFRKRNNFFTIER